MNNTHSARAGDMTITGTREGRMTCDEGGRIIVKAPVYISRDGLGIFKMKDGHGKVLSTETEFNLSVSQLRRLSDWAAAAADRMTKETKQRYGEGDPDWFDVMDGEPEEENQY